MSVFYSLSLDDVAVGAPLYTDNSAQYETGRVLVYYQTSKVSGNK